MQARHASASDFLHERFEHRPRRFDELRADLFEQIPPFLRLQRFHQMLLGGGQHALQSDNQHIADQVRADILGPATHELLLKLRHPLADGGFDLSLRFHGGQALATAAAGGLQRSRQQK